MRFLPYCVDVTKCLPNSYQNQNTKETVVIVIEVLGLKRTPSDAYTNYPEFHCAVVIRFNGHV